MSARTTIRKPIGAGRSNQAGQAMAEYVVATAFGLMVLLGPGVDIMAELARVMRENYRGYAYGMSLSAMPIAETGALFRTEMMDAGIDETTVNQLGIDPIEDNYGEQLGQIVDLKDSMVDAFNEMMNFSVEDFLDDALSSAVKFF